MSEKEKQGKISEQAAQRAKSAIITLIEYTSDREDQLHNLRLAVLEFFTVAQIQDVETDHYNPKGSYDLALSAGIEFKEGEWQLKEEGK